MPKTASCACNTTLSACASEFQYAVKMVCGEVIAHGPTPVAPGRYWTAINIHNPSKCDAATFRWKVVVAKPVGGERGSVTEYQRTETLGPDQGVEIDTENVMAALLPMPAYAKGYVVIESNIELDVVAVYTSTVGKYAESGFHTERVPGRTVPVCEDFILPLHTGLADWRTVSPSGGQLGPVEALPGHLVAMPPLGSVSVSQYSSDVHQAPVGIKTYELCFNLCFGFVRPPAFDIEVLVNDTGKVFMVSPSGQATLVGAVPFNTITRLAVDTDLLTVGNNCLRVEVNNTGGGAGFALAGLLYVPRGRCPCDHAPIAPARRRT